MMLHFKFVMVLSQQNSIDVLFFTDIDFAFYLMLSRGNNEGDLLQMNRVAYTVLGPSMPVSRFTIFHSQNHTGSWDRLPEHSNT